MPTCSIVGAISSEQSTIEISGKVRLKNGEGQLGMGNKGTGVTNTVDLPRLPDGIQGIAHGAIANSHRRCAGPFIEDLLAERGITVSRETIRLWCLKFGAIYSRRLKRKHRGYGDGFYIDEVFVKINGKQHHLWRAVDQESLPRERSECFGYGEVVDVFLQARRDGAAAKRFFKRLLRSHGAEP